MGAINFGANEQPTSDIVNQTAPVPANTTAVVVAPVSAPPARANTNLLLGDFLPSFEDIIIPRVNIVQNLGDLKDQYETGSLVYDQNVVLFVPGKANKDGSVARAATPAVNMTVLGFRPTRYVEKTTGGAKGLIVPTLADVASNGGTTDYKEWQLKKDKGMKYFQPLADALVAIERPDSIPDDDTVFLYPVEGKKYTLALWAMKGSVYTEGAKKVFFTARRMGVLAKNGYPSFGFAITTFEKQYGTSNKAWVPICKPTKASTPAFIEWVRGVLNPEAAAAPAE